MAGTDDTSLLEQLRTEALCIASILNGVRRTDCTVQFSHGPDHASLTISVPLETERLATLTRVATAARRALH